MNLVTTKREAGTSDHPTMMKLIDAKMVKVKRFGVGHFDLVIIDEAHRSVYQKYGAIFITSTTPDRAHGHATR